MKQIITILLSLIVITTNAQQLNQLERSTTQYKIPVASEEKIIGVDTTYFQKYMSLESLLDSLQLQLGSIDSLYIKDDTIFLRDGTGYAVLPDVGILKIDGLLDIDTIKVGDSYILDYDDKVITFNSGYNKISEFYGTKDIANYGLIEYDPSATNELQNMVIQVTPQVNGTDLVRLRTSLPYPGFNWVDHYVDPSTTNELDSMYINGVWLSNGDSLSVQGFDSTHIYTVIAGINDSLSTVFDTLSNYLKVEVDGSTTNEIQLFNVDGPTTLLGTEYYRQVDQFGNAHTILHEGSGIDIVKTGNFLKINSTVTADGSETKVNAGAGIGVSGSGTVGSPYVVTNTGDTNASDDITGSGASTRVPYFNGSQTVTSTPIFTYNAASSLLYTPNIKTQVIKLSADSGSNIYDNYISNGGCCGYGTANDIIIRGVDDIRFFTGGNNTAEKLTILANGNTGFGTHLPTEKFHTVGSGSLFSKLETTSYGSIASPVKLGFIFTGGGSLELGRISALDRQANTGNGKLLFETRIGASLVEVGSVEERLWKFGSGAYAGNLSGYTSYHGFWLTSSTPSFANYALLHDSDHLIINSVSGKAIKFREANVDKMRLEGGYLGIGLGTSTPSEMLHVNGRIRYATQGGTATSLVARDASGNLSTTLGQAMTVGTVASNVAPITLNGTNQFYISSDGTFNKTTEPTPNIINIAHQSHGASLSRATTQTLTASGYADFNLFSTTSGSYFAALTASDEITTTVGMPALFNVSLTVSGTADCDNDQIEVELRNNGSMVAQTKELMSSSTDVNNISLTYMDSSFTSSESYKVYIVMGGGCTDLDISDLSFNAVGF